jgi:hypothetical protein
LEAGSAPCTLLATAARAITAVNTIRIIEHLITETFAVMDLAGESPEFA